jgi:hypothetical protein
MPTQALVLALAASIYPPAVAAVIALGRGADVRPRVFAFVLASLLVTYAMGALILYVLVEAGATGPHHLTPGAAVDIGIGVLLLLLALRLHLRRRSPLAAVAERLRVGRGREAGEDESARDPAGGHPGEGQAADGGRDSRVAAGEGANGGDGIGGRSKIERYLHSRRLAFALGIVLYVLPSPIYIGAVKSIADANSSTATELTSLVAVVAIMLWMVELPMLMLIVFPAQAADTLESINLWFTRNGRTLAILATVAVGIYLIVKGIVQLS